KKNSAEEGKSGIQKDTLELWMAERPSVDAPFGPRRKLGMPIDAPKVANGYPSVTADGRLLFFTSQREGDPLLKVYTSQRVPREKIAAARQPSHVPNISDQREVAEWVIARGGYVTGRADGVAFNEISDRALLPSGSLTLLTIGIVRMKPPLTDDELAVIAAVPTLQRIILPADTITDARIARLERAGLTGLQLVPPVSDEALERLTRLPKLIYLRLNGRRCVTDEQLRIVARMPALRTLAIDDSSISDVGLQHLAALKSLTKIDARGSRITAAGVEKLHQALPNCKIGWDGDGKSEVKTQNAE
ncbi:MAG TPA: hypothetical protein VG713_03260, partial [Pirellulales bacterium]|nr:hypothetical protein [Pirellulales bacterium]